MEEFTEASEKMQEGSGSMDITRATSLRKQTTSDAKSVDWNSIAFTQLGSRQKNLSMICRMMIFRLLLLSMDTCSTLQ